MQTICDSGIPKTNMREYSRVHVCVVSSYSKISFLWTFMSKSTFDSMPIQRRHFSSRSYWGEPWLVRSFLLSVSLSLCHSLRHDSFLHYPLALRLQVLIYIIRSMHGWLWLLLICLCEFAGTAGYYELVFALLCHLIWVCFFSLSHLTLMRFHVTISLWCTEHPVDVVNLWPNANCEQCFARDTRKWITDEPKRFCINFFLLNFPPFFGQLTMRIFVFTGCEWIVVSTLPVVNGMCGNELQSIIVGMANDSHRISHRQIAIPIISTRNFETNHGESVNRWYDRHGLISIPFHRK